MVSVLRPLLVASSTLPHTRHHPALSQLRIRVTHPARKRKAHDEECCYNREITVSEPGALLNALGWANRTLA